MIDLFLAIYLAWRNSLRARIKGQNVALWVIITLLAYGIGEFLGTLLVFFFFYRGPANPAAIQNYFMNLPRSTFVFVLFCGIGGYLLIRFILERMSGKNLNSGEQA